MLHIFPAEETRLFVCPVQRIRLSFGYNVDATATKYRETIIFRPIVEI